MGRSGTPLTLHSGVRRAVVVALVIVVGAVLLLPRQTGGLFERVTRPLTELLSLPIRAITSIDQGIRGTWDRYLALQGVYDENRRLRETVAQLRGQVSEYREKLIVSEQLGEMLEFQKLAPMETVAARIIGRNATNWYRAFIIDRGTRHGLAKDMGVVSAMGVVGRVVKTNPTTAIVLLSTDPNVAIAGMIQRSRDEGIVQGTSQGFLRMKYLPPLSEVEIGDVIVTSGLTGAYPRGLPIGSVRQLEESEAELFQSVELRPTVDFSKLEGVLVIRSSGGTADEAATGDPNSTPSSSPGT